MNITFRQLQLFLALAETGSVSAAARQLHITQPTASAQLKEISESVGVPLYEVIARKVHFTEAGHELEHTARNLLNEWAMFEQHMDAVKGLVRGRLRIAVVSTAKYFIPRILGEFCQQYPEIDISLAVLNRDGVIGRLEENMDDIYIMSAPPAHIDLIDEVLMHNPMQVIAPEAHPLARRAQIALEELGDYRFILRERGAGTRLAIDEHFRKHRFTPDLRMELGSNEAIREAVAGGLGISVISAASLQRSRHDMGVRVLHVEGFPIESYWHIVHPKAKKLSPIARVFKNYLIELARSDEFQQGIYGENGER